MVSEMNRRLAKDVKGEDEACSAKIQRTAEGVAKE